MLSKIQKCRPFNAFNFGKSTIAIELKFRNVISAFQWFLFLGLVHENSNTNNQASFCDFIPVAKFNFIFVTNFLTNVTTIESEGVIIDGNMTWVQSYAVSISNDSRSWTAYSEKGISNQVDGSTTLYKRYLLHELAI